MPVEDSSNEAVSLLLLIFMFLTGVKLYRRYCNVCIYWKDRGIAYIKPIPIFGNAFSVLTGQKSIGNYFYEIYQSSDAPYEGFFILDEPWLFIRNPHIITSIFVKDFEYFTDRAAEQNVVDDKIGSNLTFFLQGREWKYIRGKMSRTTTPLNMKYLYSQLNIFGDEFISNIAAESKTGAVKILNALKIFSIKFLLFYICGAKEQLTDNKITDVIEKLDCIMGPKFTRIIQITSTLLGVWYVEPFGIKFVPSSAAKFFRKLFREAAENVRTRQETLIKNGLLEYILNLKQHDGDENRYLFDDDYIVAHALSNLIGGMDTVPVTISCALFELSLNEEIQDRARSEILDVFKGTCPSYNDMNKMPYLEMIVKETLRKYPPFPFLDRRCTKDYQLPGSNITISKGTRICTSLQGLHHDPQYFQKPEDFDPERFSNQNVGSIPTGVYMPLGIGPRTCLGEQLARCMVKVALVKVLTKFTVHSIPSTRLNFSALSLVKVPSHTPQLIFKEIDV